MFEKISKQVYIEQGQDKLLKELAQQAGVTEAEIIRQAIDLHISSIAVTQTNLAAWEAEKEFIKSIKNRLSLPGGRDWRREDLYER